MDQRLILLTQLIKLGVAAAVASALVRSLDFKRLLFRQKLAFRQKIHLVILISIPFLLGVWVRQSVRNFLAADLAFEACILMGALTGPFAGMVGAALVSIPAVIHGEFATLPFNVVVGLLTGWLRNLASDPEYVWSFSPFFDLSIYRWLRRMFRHRRFDWQTGFFFVIVALQFAHIEIGQRFPGKIFYVAPAHNLSDQAFFWTFVAIYAATVAVVAIPLKIWNAARLELKLEEHERLLLQARMEALQSQINPHFLFNTLNSVSSLVRVDPDTARLLIIKLANILRRMLRQTEAFVRLEDELDFIDDYLDIEVVRFGRDKLRVIKDVELDSLDAMVPSMLLQPLIENSIKHGIAPKIEGGSIILRSRLSEEALTIELEDDGVGMTSAIEIGGSPAQTAGTGIGMSNVAERLKVIYGDAAHMRISSRDAGGTLITLNLPLIGGASARGSATDAIAEASRYAARSSTLR